MEESEAKAYRFPRTRKMTLDENWLYFGGGLFAFSQVGALLMQRWVMMGTWLQQENGW